MLFSKVDSSEPSHFSFITELHMKSDQNTWSINFKIHYSKIHIVFNFPQHPLLPSHLSYFSCHFLSSSGSRLLVNAVANHRPVERAAYEIVRVSSIHLLHQFRHHETSGSSPKSNCP